MAQLVNGDSSTSVQLAHVATLSPQLATFLLRAEQNTCGAKQLFRRAIVSRIGACSFMSRSEIVSLGSSGPDN